MVIGEFYGCRGLRGEKGDKDDYSVFSLGEQVDINIFNRGGEGLERIIMDLILVMVSLSCLRDILRETVSQYWRLCFGGQDRR